MGDYTSIIVAIITGLMALLTAIISVRASNKEMTSKLEQSLAVMEAKLDNVVDEVREHNSFAQKMPVVEEQIKNLQHRIEILEKQKGA